MRTLRILSLLFSLFQFLLVLKLIEFVRGDPIPNQSVNLPSSEELIRTERDSRHFFVAPNQKKKRKFKPWVTSSETPTTDYPYDGSDGVEPEAENELSNSTKLDRMGFIIETNSTVTVPDSNTPAPDESARLCPGCAGGQCGAATTPYGFPVIEVFIAFVVGIIWFFIFLYIWYFVSEPSTGNAPSSGYGYGDSTGGWSPSSGSSGSDGYLDSFWDLFKGRGQQRSFDRFNELTSLVTDSLFKLGNLYSL